MCLNKLEHKLKIDFNCGYEKNLKSNIYLYFSSYMCPHNEREFMIEVNHNFCYKCVNFKR